MNTISENIKTLIDSSTLSENTVAIYDIDGTLLTTTYDPARAKPIMPIVDTYNYALSKGIMPIIITAREGSLPNVHATVEQLKYHGIKNFHIIYFRPSDIYDVANYKLLARKNVVERNFSPLYSVGDMPFDIGAYGGYGFQVPISEETYNYQVPA